MSIYVIYNMACQNKSVQDIESIIEERDSMFSDVLQHIDSYYKCINKLFSYFKIHQHDMNFKNNFQKQISSLTKEMKGKKVSKIYLIYAYQKMIREGKIESDSIFWSFIQKNPSRNMSGVNSFALLLSPEPDGRTGESCQHNCYYCPDETKKNGAEDDMPRSYLKKEPAVQRGFRNGWDAIRQMNDRLNSLLVQGHELDKLELIIEGGTYTEFPPGYLQDFNRDIYYAANTYYDTPKRKKFDIEKEMNINMTTKIRIIGMCIETRPDAINPFWINFFRYNGITRVQLGVQHVDNSILKKINRGHTFEQSCEAVEILKNNCFKVDIHLMPDLPYSTPEKDKHMFDVVFKTDIISPDQVKIYPCEITPYTVIEKWYKSGKYKPYSDEDPEILNNVIEYGMKLCPYHVRLPRIVRDIPLNYIISGNKFSNLRQLLESKVKKQDYQLKEIRSREIGRHLEYIDRPKKIMYRKYKGGTCKEYFISCESLDHKVIFGFIRLRIPNTNHKPYFHCLKNKGLIRELHVYNHIVPVGIKRTTSTQHMGIGKSLLKYAEMIAWMEYCDGTAVITGEGVRSYYHKRGYSDEDSFVVKRFTSIKYYILIHFIVFYYFIKIFVVSFYF